MTSISFSDYLIGLSATLLEKENELSKIQKELKLLEPYKVGRCRDDPRSFKTVVVTIPRHLTVP